MTLQINLKQLKADGALNSHVMVWSAAANAWTTSDVNGLVNFSSTPDANSTVSGLIKVVDSTSNTGTLVAASANSVATAYVIAVTAQNMAANAYSNAISVAAIAYTNAVSYATTVAATAYANAYYWANALSTTAYANAITYAASNTYVNNTFAPLSGATFTGAVQVSNTLTLTANVVMGNNYITGLRSPTNAQDAANKQYVDDIAEGLRAKPSARAATTTNLSAIYNNGSSGVGATLTADTDRAFTTLDGVTSWAITSPPMGVLVKNQSNTAHNGRYNLTSLGQVGVSPWVLTRCGLCDEADEIPGSYTFVVNGTLNGGTGWVQSVADPDTFTVGTDAITMFQFSGAGTYTPGSYLSLSGTQFSANASSAATASVLIARDSNGSFAANNANLVTLSVSGATTLSSTLAAGNTTITGSLLANTGLLSANTIQFNDGSQQTTFVDPIAMAIALG